MSSRDLIDDVPQRQWQLSQRDLIADLLQWQLSQRGLVAE